MEENQPSAFEKVRDDVYRLRTEAGVGCLSGCLFVAAGFTGAILLCFSGVFLLIEKGLHPASRVARLNDRTFQILSLLFRNHPYCFWAIVIVGFLSMGIAFVIYIVEKHYFKTITMDVKNRTYHYTLGYSWKSPDVDTHGHLDEDCEGVTATKTSKLVTIGKGVSTHYGYSVSLMLTKGVGCFVLHEYWPERHRLMDYARECAQKQADSIADLLQVPVMRKPTTKNKRTSVVKKKKAAKFPVMQRYRRHKR